MTTETMPTVTGNHDPRPDDDLDQVAAEVEQATADVAAGRPTTVTRYSDLQRSDDSAAAARAYRAAVERDAAARHETLMRVTGAAAAALTTPATPPARDDEYIDVVVKVRRSEADKIVAMWLGRQLDQQLG